MTISPKVDETLIRSVVDQAIANGTAPRYQTEVVVRKMEEHELVAMQNRETERWRSESPVRTAPQPRTLPPQPRAVSGELPTFGKDGAALPPVLDPKTPKERMEALLAKTGARRIPIHEPKIVEPIVTLQGRGTIILNRGVVSQMGEEAGWKTAYVVIQDDVLFLIPSRGEDGDYRFTAPKGGRLKTASVACSRAIGILGYLGRTGRIANPTWNDNILAIDFSQMTSIPETGK